jgi:hypothetical protein
MAYVLIDRPSRRNSSVDHSASGELVLQGRTGETATGADVRLWAGRITD